MLNGPHVQSLVYSMVAREEVMLAHHSAFPSVSASFAALAAACLRNVRIAASASADNLLSYKSDDHTFHFLVQDSFTYLVVSSNSEGDKIALAYLHRIKEEFYNRYGDAISNGESYMAHSLDKDFGPRLKYHIEHCLDNSHKVRKVWSMKDPDLEKKEVLVENIEKVLENKESITLQIEHTDIFHAQVENFHRQGQQLKKKMQRRQIKLRLSVLLVSIVIILSIWLAICKGFNC